MLKIDYRFNNNAPLFKEESEYTSWTKELKLAEVNREENDCFTYIVCISAERRIEKHTCFIAKKQVKKILR
jgi:hypothetical protein